MYPFFAGLDIARDIEIYPVTQQDLVVFDGWGGINPVPVNDTTNPVFNTRNEDPNNLGMSLTTVGMPYIIAGSTIRRRLRMMRAMRPCSGSMQSL